MATGLYNWSQIANNNANATYNWAEGMAPSAVNDSARGIMSDVAKWRDDISGALVTAGTSTGYTINSNSAFDSLAHLSGQLIAFTPHVANGATVTLNVDGLGAKPLRSSPNVELQSNVLISGTPYVAVYNNSDAAFYLYGNLGNCGMPLAAGMDYWGSTAPSSAFAFPTGQVISRTTYAALFALIGTTYGTGDGSTTFNLPDKTGRVSAMKEASATRLTSSFFGGNSTVAGAVGGFESKTLALSDLPTGITSAQNGLAIAVSSTNVIPSNSVWHTNSIGNTGSDNAPATGGAIQYLNQTSTGSINVAVTSNNTSGAAHRTVQPTIICNYIIRVL